jgi:hypothetical protein
VQLQEARGDSSQFCLDTGRYYDQLCAPSINKYLSAINHLLRVIWINKYLLR